MQSILNLDVKNAKNCGYGKSFESVLQTFKMLDEVLAKTDSFLLISNDFNILYKSKQVDYVLKNKNDLQKVIEQIVSEKITGKMRFKDMIISSEPIQTSRKREKLFFILMSNENEPEFQGGISVTDKCYHDIQEPLRNIANFLQLLSLHATETNDSTAKKYVRYALDSVYKLKNWTHDLLNRSKISVKNNISGVSVNCIISEINRILRYQITSRKCVLSAHGNIPHVACSKSDIFGVFKNLIENSIKYAKVENLNINIYEDEYSFKESNEVNIIFEDNGANLNQTDIEKIKSSLSSDGTYLSHSGFGLSMCKNTIESYNGRMEFIGENFNNLCKFSITLPKWRN